MTTRFCYFCCFVLPVKFEIIVRYLSMNFQKGTTGLAVLEEVNFKMQILVLFSKR